MNVIKVENNKYKLIKDYRECFNEEEFLDKCTDYFFSFDFIVGDYAYGKLRLKGFNNQKNPNFNKYNDYEKVDKYIKENCAYGCAYFIVEKIID